MSVCKQRDHSRKTFVDKLALMCGIMCQRLLTKFNQKPLTSCDHRLHVHSTSPKLRLGYWQPISILLSWTRELASIAQNRQVDYFVGNSSQPTKPKIRKSSGTVLRERHPKSWPDDVKRTTAHWPLESVIRYFYDKVLDEKFNRNMLSKTLLKECLDIEVKYKTWILLKCFVIT